MLDNPITRAAAGLAAITILFGFIVWLLPTYEMPDDFQTALHWAFSLLWELNFAIPIPTILFFIGIYLIMDFAFAGIRIISAVYKNAKGL